MRWMLGLLATLVIVIAVACGPHKDVFTSVYFSGTGFYLENYVPLSGGELQWTGVQHSSFSITILGDWCSPPKSHSDGPNTIVTCTVPRHDKLAIYAYVIQSKSRLLGTTVQQVATMPVGPCKSCPAQQPPSKPKPPSQPQQPSPPPPGTPVNAIYCNTSSDPASVYVADGSNMITAPIGTTVYWIATGDSTGSVNFPANSNPCAAGSYLQSGVYLSCQVIGPAMDTPYTYTASDQSCKGGTLSGPLPLKVTPAQR